MKNLYPIIHICLTFGLLGCSPKRKENSVPEESLKLAEERSLDKSTESVKKTSIDDIVIGLLKVHPNLKVGMEDLQSLNDIVSAHLDPNVSETDAEALSRVSALIEKQSDYECRVYNHWLIIAPRPNKDRFDLPTALRLCASPAVTGMPVYEFLSKLKGAKHGEELTLVHNQTFYIPNEPEGLIDSEPRSAPCFQVLSDVADQLSVRCWRVSHMHLEAAGKVLLPLHLQTGLVRFHAPGEIRSATGNAK